MRKIVFLTIALLTLCVSYAQNRNNVIVYDITGSMVGDPPGSRNLNIWDESLNLLKSQMASFVDLGESVQVYVFGEKLHHVATYKSGVTQSNINEVIRAIDKYKVTGKLEGYTYLYKSLSEVLKGLGSDLQNTIYLFTDGKNTERRDAPSNIDHSNVLSQLDQLDAGVDHLYIFKLKSFNLPNEFVSSDKVDVIEDALHNYVVTIEPLNKSIQVTSRNLTSNQKFRLSGTGASFLPENIIIRTKCGELKSNSNRTSIDISSQLKTHEQVQSFNVCMLNAVKNIPNEKYSGSISYEFDNGQKKRTVKCDNGTITIKIVHDSCTLTFDNRNIPTVEIEFVD